MAGKLNQKYVVDNKGKTVSVLLDIKTYKKMLSDLEELESIRTYDAAKSSEGEFIPFEEAIQEIESSKQCNTPS